MSTLLTSVSTIKAKSTLVFQVSIKEFEAQRVDHPEMLRAVSGSPVSHPVTAPGRGWKALGR